MSLKQSSGASKKRTASTRDGPSEEPKAKKKRLSAPVSQNWKNLQQQLAAESKPTVNYREIRQQKKNKKQSPSQSTTSTQDPPPNESKNNQPTSNTSTAPLTNPNKKNVIKKLVPLSQSTQITKVIGLDCEMVGIGPEGFDSALARVTIVNSFGSVVYDKHVQVPEKVTNYRTKFSGIRKEDLVGAMPFGPVQQEVADLIKDRIVVGHGLKNDFKALMLQHPFTLTRDTARYGPLQRSKGRPHALRQLTKALFGIQIQSGEHDSAEDARAAVLVYKHVKDSWEKSLNGKKYKSKQIKKTVTNTSTSNGDLSAPADSN